MFVNAIRLRRRCHLLSVTAGCWLVAGAICAAGQPDAAGTADPEKRADDTPRGPRVRLVTSLGDVELELFADKAPVSVENFLAYVRSGFYDGLVFHRVVPNFMIQAGGFDENLDARTNGLLPPIKNESANLLKNERGTVAMARLSEPHSATSQFFINLADNPHLDRTRRQPYGYAVFGRVVGGMDVVERIAAARCIQHDKDPRRGVDGPVNPDPPIIIKKALILEDEPPPAEESPPERDDPPQE